MEDPLETRPLDEEVDGRGVPPQSRGAGDPAAQPRTSADDLPLAELAGIDELLRERDAVWKDLVHRLEGLRREIAVASAQVQRSRSLAVRRKPRDDDTDQDASPSAPTRDEARATRLTQEFEAALRDTEQRRVALHAEMDDLRRRREALLRQLPASISRAYQSLTEGHRRPAIAAVANGARGACEAPLPEFVIEQLSQGAAVACARCERLLRLARPVE